MTWVRGTADAALAGLLVAVMATALVREAPHEYLGAALFATAVAHAILNRRRFKALLRGRRNAAHALCLIAIAGLIACLVGQLASALVLSKFAFGFLPALPGASLARRVHMLCSYWGFTLAFAHAGLHIKALGRPMRAGGAGKASGATRRVVWAARLLFAALSCFGVYSFVKLDFGAYLLGQVQFAFADYGTPVVSSLMSYASIAVLIGGLFHYLRVALKAFERSRRRVRNEVTQRLKEGGFVE